MSGADTDLAPYVRVNLAAAAEEVGRARRVARRALGELGFVDLIDDGELVASELVTNAVNATSEPRAQERIILTVSVDGGCPVIEVTDAVWWVHPVPRVTGEESTGGRGLVIVACLAAKWGERVVQEGGVTRKCVWARLKQGGMSGES